MSLQVFWFTTERFVDGGNMFGSSPAFHGMGIVIDTFDNDQQVTPNLNYLHLFYHTALSS